MLFFPLSLLWLWGSRAYTPSSCGTPALVGLHFPKACEILVPPGTEPAYPALGGVSSQTLDHLGSLPWFVVINCFSHQGWRALMWTRHDRLLLPALLVLEGSQLLEARAGGPSRAGSTPPDPNAAQRAKRQDAGFHQGAPQTQTPTGRPPPLQRASPGTPTVSSPSFLRCR